MIATLSYLYWRWSGRGRLPLRSTEGV